jgi:hypothetical protein
MAQLPRGIDPGTLLSQVRNTMPYLFDPGTGGTALGQMVPAQVLRAFEGASQEPLGHFEYFRLCLSSHYLTCATPVPTDVDNQIRQKLWPRQLPLETALEMTALVLASRQWDFKLLSNRCVYGAPGTPWEKESLSGHLGEWFTVSSAAYCALGQYPDPRAGEMRKLVYENIADEVRRHSEIFGSLWRANEGSASLKASANIAHNFGDLDRVMDMWELSPGDPLRLEFYKLTATPFDADRKLRYLGRLWVAGELYKSEIEGSSMALENHRHFALRKPKCLRQSPELRIPLGPFFDDWGRLVARTLAASDGAPSERTFEVIEALWHGWERLPKTVGYGRALRGIGEVHPELGFEAQAKTHVQRSILQMPQERFEKKWNDEALKLMDDIPSRA